MLIIALFPWNAVREPLNRYVSERTGREFSTTALDVRIGRTTRILLQGVALANPDWARDRYLVRAEAAEIEVRLLPLLLYRRVELPLVALRKPQLGLQMEADGRRTWALARNTGDPGKVPDIGALAVDQGIAHFVAAAHAVDVRADFAIEDPAAGPQEPGLAPQSLPLRFNARGTWRNEPFTAKGRTGNVLQLSAGRHEAFPMEIDAAAGATRLTARGAIGSLKTLDGAHADVDLQGRNLAELYKLIGVVLPETPQYSVRGRVSRAGAMWQVRGLAGKLGNTDVAGELSFDPTGEVPHLAGYLVSRWLDFNDLAPLVGLQDRPRGPRAEQAQGRADGRARAPKPPREPMRKVLPQAALDLGRLKAMNADVTYSAARVTNVRQLPLERIAVRARLQSGVLNLDPLDLGMAGGTLAGRMRIDSHADPAVVEAHLDGRSLELRKLMRNEQLIKSSFGRIHADVDLTGRGNSAAQMLASASGSMSLLMGPGQISNLLLEFAGLDGGEILKFLIGGDRNISVRCAATAFDVKQGVMTSRALLLDTVDTVIWGDGHVNFGTEALDLYLRPYPKDTSILSLRAPIQMGGTLGAPQAGPDKTVLGGRAALAAALAAVNPLLALAATIETGPGHDANCSEVLRRAASPRVSPAAARASQQAREDQAKRGTGGPGATAGSLLGLEGKSLAERERAHPQPDAAKPAKRPASAATGRP
ncbi:AsmA family protein [Ramlibacter solisilvae]